MYSHIIKDFQSKLDKLKEGKRINLEKANEGIHLCNNTLYLLRNIIEKQDFKSEKDEIYFFKKVKVKPLSALVYFNEIRSCQLLMPKMGFEDQFSYLKKKARRINKFFNKNWDFVHYMDQDLNYLDKQYFTRKNQSFPLYSTPEACYLDPSFFTSHDMLCAKIKGLNCFTEHLKVLIEVIKLQREDFKYKNNKKLLVWTESKTALVELIYAIDAVCAVNSGEDGIKAIASALEETFNIKVGNIYKIYSEIKMRKGSKAKFLENLITSFNHKIEQDDAL
ncbi:MAG: RteC domain-containing protein [Algibacter sp.]